jgi:hypothetical protein
MLKNTSNLFQKIKYGLICWKIDDSNLFCKLYRLRTSESVGGDALVDEFLSTRSRFILVKEFLSLINRKRVFKLHFFYVSVLDRCVNDIVHNLSSSDILKK